MRITSFNLSGIRRMRILNRAYRYVQRGPGGAIILEDEETQEQSRHTDLDLYEHLARGEFKVLPAKAPSEEDAEREFRARQLDLLRRDPILNRQVHWRFKFVLAHAATGETRITRPILAAVIKAVVDAEREALEQRNALRLAGEPEESLLSPPTPSTLQVWIRDYRAAGWDLVGLIPRYVSRGHRREEYDDDTIRDVEAAFEETFLQMNGGSISDTYKTAVANVAEREGIPEAEARTRLPSIRFFYRFRDERYDRYTIDLRREGKEVADNRWRPFGSGPTYDRINSWWEIDTTELTQWLIVWGPNDLIIGHPYITVVYDRYSRCPVGYYIGWEPGGFLPAIKAIRHALLPKDLSRFQGIKNPWPCFGRCTGGITVDNDPGLVSENFLEALTLLFSDVDFAPARAGWYKGRIERFFRTLQGQFRSVPGAYFSDYYRRKGRKVPERASLVTMEKLEELITKWICDHYLVSPHDGLAERRPVQVWQDSVEIHGIVPPPDDELLDAALSLTDFRVPSKGGIVYEGLRYNSPALANIRIAPSSPDRVRIKIDPENLGSIRVHDPENDSYVPVPVISSQRGIAEGVPLRAHLMARAMVRNNPERYEGDESQVKALVEIMRSTRSEMGKGTQKQRRFHARHQFKDSAQALDPKTLAPGDIVDPFADIEFLPDMESAPSASTPPTTSGDQTAGPVAPETTLDEDSFDFDAEAERLGIKPKK